MLAESCPLCLQSFEDTAAHCVLICCRELRCQHVIHSSCLLQPPSPLRPSLSRLHATQFFRSVVAPAGELDPVQGSLMDHPGSKRYILELEISHILSNAQVKIFYHSISVECSLAVQIARIDWPFQMCASFDQRTSREYLLSILNPTTHKVQLGINVKAVF